MLKILLLICPVSIDHAACNESNARDVVRAFRVPNAEQCAFMGQGMLAPSALIPDPKKEYLKVVCLRAN